MFFIKIKWTVIFQETQRFFTNFVNPVNDVCENYNFLLAWYYFLFLVVKNSFLKKIRSWTYWKYTHR
jgi:hypothetical protein